MAGYALVKDGKVINLILWDGVEMDFGEGVTAVEIKDSDNVSIGFNYTEGKFIAPPLTDEQIEAQKKDKITYNRMIKAQLISEATQTISILQDAVDLEMATNDEINGLTLWKKYRVFLSRIDAEVSADISFPEKPSIP